MRFFNALVAGLSLVAGVMSAKAKTKTDDRFATYHSSLLRSTPLKLDTKSYQDLTAQPRDYSVAVLLTAMDPKYQCQLCREFDPEWSILTNSWVKGDKAGESKVIFATLDFNNGREIFQQLGLSTAPVLMQYPPTTGPHAKGKTDPERHDFNMGPHTAEHVHEIIARAHPGRPHPPVKRPIDYMAWAINTVIVVGTVTVLIVIGPYLIPAFQSRNLWAAISLISILIFISGHMFNQIRNIPYVAMARDGGVTYFAGGFQNQLGLETQVIAALYGILSFCSISLAIKAPRIANPTYQRFAILTLSGIILVVYSTLLSIFRMKNGGYPFRLPPFF